MSERDEFAVVLISVPPFTVVSARGAIVTDIRIVHVFVLSYTSYFHIVDRSTGDSKQDRYSHRIIIRVVTSDYAGMITNCDIRCWC